MSLFGKRHSKLKGNDAHTIVWKEVADAAARLALIVSEDKEGFVVKQLDNGSYWILEDYTGPTWVEISAVGVAAVTSVAGRDGDVVLTETDITDLGSYPDSTGQAVTKVAQTDGAGGWTFIDTPTGGTGTTDHGALTGLGDDDHTQYHNNTRGDARYYTKAQVDSAVGVPQGDIDAHLLDLSNPHEVDATDVGLGNVNNTSDANKPISTATQTALDLKAATADARFPTADQKAALVGGDPGSNPPNAGNPYVTLAEVAALGGGDVIKSGSSAADRLVTWVGTGASVDDSGVDLTDVQAAVGHASDSDNPHSTSIANIAAGTYDQLSSAITDETLVKQSDSVGVLSDVDLSGIVDGNTLVWATDTFVPGVGGGGGDLSAADIDTLAELNAIVADATLIDTGDSRLSDDRTASGLRTATTVVSLSAATAPTVNQVLTAINGTTATWQDAAGGSATALATTGADVVVNSAAPPTVGQVLKATGATTATWQDESGAGSFTARQRAVAAVTAPISANTLITSATNLSASLIDYQSYTFDTDLEIYINGNLMRNGADSGDDFDVYPSAVSGEQAVGAFYCEFALNTDDVVQMMYGTGTGGTVSDFVDLGDVTDYSGHGDEYVKVNAGGTGLEYGTPSGGGAESTYHNIEARVTINDSGTWRGCGLHQYKANQVWTGTFGSGSDPAPAYFSVDGFLVPFDGVITSVEFWTRAALASPTTMHLYKQTYTDGTTTAPAMSLIGSAISVATAPTVREDHSTVFSSSNAVSKGDIICPYFLGTTTTSVDLLFALTYKLVAT